MHTPFSIGSRQPQFLSPKAPSMTHPIPQPRKIPFLGNLASIDREAPTNSYMLLYQQYGEIFRLDLIGAFDIHHDTLMTCSFLTRSWNLGRTVVVINSYNLLHEICDDKRFSKAVVAHLKEIAGLVHDGLFTFVNSPSLRLQSCSVLLKQSTNRR